MELSGHLGVHAAELSIVGSAQLGFSLRPDQLLRGFRAESDLDVVVVSSSIFDAAWRDLLERRISLKTLEEDDRKRLRRTQDNFFYGYLRPDHLPSGTALVRDWFPKLAGPFTSPIAARHPVKAWLFKSWWHAEAFYCDGISKVQRRIAEVLGEGG